MNRTAVEQIKERISIDELIGTYVKLEKAGKSFKARCPFHNEKSPSFFVSPDRGGYYCFGCGAKGDIFSFVEQFEGLDFRGALKILAEKAGVKLIFDQKADGERDKLFQIMEDATRYFEDQLSKNKEASEYVKRRGITDTTRASFRIGWAPEGWQNLQNHLKTKGYSDVLIERAGLIKKRDNSSEAPNLHDTQVVQQTSGASVAFAEQPVYHASSGRSEYYDRFRGRVVFPISDSSGRIVAFSGRILKDDMPAHAGGKSAKYLNSPDTPLFDKSQILYGLDKAKGEIRRLGYSIFVEGQMDLVMSHQAGIKNTVASSGTALTDETIGESGAVSNLGLVRRLSPNIIIAFDSDSAGRKAALRASGIALSMGMDVKIADLVGGKDPADLVLNNPEDWKAVLRSAKPIVEFELGNVIRDTPDHRKIPRALRERVFPFLARIDSQMDKDHFVQLIADKANIGKDSIWQDLRSVEEKIKQDRVSNSGKATPAVTSSGTSSSQARGLVASDQRPQGDEKMHVHEDGRGYSSISRIDLVERRMFGLLLLMEKESMPIAQDCREQIKKICADSYADRYARIDSISSDVLFEADAMFGADTDRWPVHMKELIINFEMDLVNQDLIDSMQELKVAEKSGNTIRVTELAKKCQVLSVRKAEIAKKR